MIKPPIPRSLIAVVTTIRGGSMTFLRVFGWNLSISQLFMAKMSGEFAMYTQTNNNYVHQVSRMAAYATSRRDGWERGHSQSELAC